MAICLLSVVTVFTACNSDEVSNIPTLSVFGPSPALRGGVVKFIGTNLDKVTSIILPNNLEVTDITKTSSTEISITIPQGAQPGLLTLKTSSGDIKTKTPLTFSEPITIDKYTTTSVKAGNVFTLEGDYLNLIAQVIFTDGAVVDSANFVSKTRKKIEVYVPITAKTGKVAVSNGATIPVLVYTADVATITIPVVASIAPYTSVKPGNTITIMGTDLNLVKKLTIPGDNGETAFTLNSGKTAITAILPDNVKDGVVTLTTFSGIIITAGNSLEVAFPSASTVAPTPVKNGAELTISGTNLELVKSVKFPNVSNAATEFNSQSATEIKLTVPVAAQAGTLLLTAASGKTSSVAYTLVMPSVVSTSASIIGGQALTLHGTDLDLVSSVSFEGSSETVSITSQTTDAIVIIIPNTIVGNAKINFTCKNGTAIQATSVTVTPTSLAYITAMNSSGNQGETLTLIGGNLDKIISVTLAGKSLTWVNSGSSIMFIVIPSNCTPGNQQLVITTAGGTTSYTLKVIGTGPTITAIWKGSQDMGSWSGYIQLSDASLFSSVVIGDQILVTVDPTSISSSSQGSFKNGSSWGAIASGTDYFTITGDFTLDVTFDILPQLQSSGLIIGGQKYIATKVSIVH